MFFKQKENIMSTKQTFKYEMETISLPAGMKYIVRHKVSSARYGNDLHYHDHYEAFFSRSGNILYSIEGRKYQLSVGTLLLISPYEFHQLCEQTDVYADRIGLRFNASLLESLSTSECNLATCFDTQSPTYTNLYQFSEAQQREIDYILQGLLNEQNGSRFGTSLAEQTLLTQFFLLINRASIEESQMPALFDPAAQLVRQVIDYMEQHYAESITLELLEKKFYLSRYQITRDFTRLVGCPPYRYLLQKRLQHAQRLLNIGITPQQVAIQCGFSDYTNFYRRFKNVYGISPRAYCKQHDKNLYKSN